MEERSMPSDTQTASASKKKLWAGRIFTTLVALMLLGSAVGKLLNPEAVLKSFAHFGYPEGLIVGIGILEIACTIVYLIPRTSILGAILVTGYLGGATATNVRVGDPAFAAPIVFGILVWAGLYLRDDRLRAFIPLRTPPSA
jgi:hypothetical protein